MLSLYRIVEASSGTIRIDGLDIATIGLYDLRSKLSLVPQDPVIFSGTVRDNLDPFGDAGSDDRIWEALKRSGMDNFVRSMEVKLLANLAYGMEDQLIFSLTLMCTISRYKKLSFVNVAVHHQMAMHAMNAYGHWTISLPSAT